MRIDQKLSPYPARGHRNPVLLVLLLMGVLDPDPAAAYIDPNIGGQIYQIFYPIFALVAGVLVFMREQLKIMAEKVISAFRRMFRNDP
ncbi:hypothetical protein [Thermaurantiacus sp.]